MTRMLPNTLDSVAPFSQKKLIRNAGVFSKHSNQTNAYIQIFVWYFIR